MQRLSTTPWLTFRQATELGARVRGGEHGTTVVFYKLTELPEQSADRTAIQYRTVPLLRSFTVFNVAQIDGLPEAMTKPPEPAVWDAHVEAEALLYASGAEIHHGGDQAYYQRAKDIVHLPPRSSFAAAGDYYATALHELVHWTGHEKRCNRNLTGRFGDDAYAMEELVAEMGSAYLCAHCRLDGSCSMLRIFTPGSSFEIRQAGIFTASAKAQAGADYATHSQPVQAEEAAHDQDRIIQRALKILAAGYERPALNSPSAVREYLRLSLAGREHEVFICLFLDAQNRVIEVNEMFRGTLTQTQRLSARGCESGAQVQRRSRCVRA